MNKSVFDNMLMAFKQRMTYQGYQVVDVTGDDFLFAVEKDGIQLFRADKDGDIYYHRQPGREQEQRQLHHLFLDMQEAYQLFDKAKPLDLPDVEDFRLISEMGKAVLAANMSSNGEIRFVTWEYNHDRSGVIWGHYYETNFEAAKKDFAIRAELLSEDELFSKNEMISIYAASIYRRNNDPDMNCQEESRLDDVITKIQNNLSDILEIEENEDCIDQEQETER
ncbi:MAG: hypothetical protein ACRDBO_17565 [Lachnospiraceae bacterium]